ncbi:MAG: Vms1/Ankzf1 family peptidyl-tRNA hydrolase [Halobacteriaceae archaeon]
MLDELLGRASLKERIADLEAENESLREQLEAEQERRADAVTERQSAEERVNRLEDRVTELEDRVERAGGEGGGPSFRAHENLRGERRDEVLSRLRSVETGPEGALTAMVPDGSAVPDAVRDALGERTPLVARAAPCLVCVDDANVVAAAIDPPVAPDAFTEWGESFRIEAPWVRPVGRHAVALVRSDLFALGVFDGRERVAARGFTSAVKGGHSKGGFSQGRFERLREGQIADHVEKCRDAIADADADRVFVVGETSLLHEFADVADETAPADATGDPEEALAAAVDDFWTVSVWSL